jgi:hypothetical protein
LPDAVHEPLPLRHPHYRDRALSHCPFHGHHNPGCHSRPNTTGRKSTPALGEFKSYYSSWGDSENVESGKSPIEKNSHLVQRPYHNLTHSRADGDQNVVWVVSLWTCCPARDHSDAMAAAPSSVTPVTIPIMILRIMPSAWSAS